MEVEKSLAVDIKNKDAREWIEETRKTKTDLSVGGGQAGNTGSSSEYATSKITSSRGVF
jgi:hypothetical protein